MHCQLCCTVASMVVLGSNSIADAMVFGYRTLLRDVSPSSGDLCVRLLQMASLVYILSREQAPLSYLSDKNNFLCQLDDEKK